MVIAETLKHVISAILKTASKMLISGATEAHGCRLDRCQLHGIFFANGNSDNDTDTSVTLGTAYQNTSIVIYERTLREISASQDIDLSLLESTTLHHEFGHLFGLVNIQDDDIHQNHEDPFQARHCVVEDCLMFFETRLTNRAATRNYFNRRKNAVDIPQFDANLCIEDIQAKGGS